jgi:excisionase family DNA binding protein
MDMLLTPRNAADALQISVRTLERLRVTGNGPAFVKTGNRLVRYRQADLENWLASRARHSTSECRS